MADVDHVQYKEDPPSRRKARIVRYLRKRFDSFSSQYLQKTADALAAKEGIEPFDVAEALAAPTFSEQIEVATSASSSPTTSASSSRPAAPPDRDFWATAITQMRKEGQLDTLEARDRQRAKTARESSTFCPDSAKRHQAEQRVEWALNAPLDELEAALRKPPTQTRAVKEVDEKYSHAARTRRPPMRSRERRPSSRRSRAAPADDSSGPEPPGVRAQPALPLSLVAARLEILKIPHAVSRDGVLLIAWWCPCCSRGADIGCWFTEFGPACAGGCEPDEILSALGASG